MQIPYEIFNAACICASIDPNRKTFYKTIIVTEDSRLVSADGGMMYVSNPLFGLTPRAIMFHGVLPPACILVELRENTAVGFDKNNKEVKYAIISTIKVDFPDWENKVVWDECPLEENTEIGWGLPILKKVVRMFGTDDLIKYYSGGFEHPTRIVGNHGTVWVMPCRI